MPSSFAGTSTALALPGVPVSGAAPGGVVVALLAVVGRCESTTVSVACWLGTLDGSTGLCASLLTPPIPSFSLILSNRPILRFLGLWWVRIGPVRPAIGSLRK